MSRGVHRFSSLIALLPVPQGYCTGGLIEERICLLNIMYQPRQQRTQNTQRRQRYQMHISTGQQAHGHMTRMGLKEFVPRGASWGVLRTPHERSAMGPPPGGRGHAFTLPCDQSASDCRRRPFWAVRPRRFFSPKRRFLQVEGPKGPKLAMSRPAGEAEIELSICTFDGKQR